MSFPVLKEDMVREVLKDLEEQGNFEPDFLDLNSKMSLQKLDSVPAAKCLRDVLKWMIVNDRHLGLRSRKLRLTVIGEINAKILETCAQYRQEVADSARKRQHQEDDVNVIEEGSARKRQRPEVIVIEDDD
jgi:hypothetical protein